MKVHMTFGLLVTLLSVVLMTNFKACDCRRFKLHGLSKSTERYNLNEHPTAMTMLIVVFAFTLMVPLLWACCCTNKGSNNMLPDDEVQFQNATNTEAEIQRSSRYHMRNQTNQRYTGTPFHFTDPPPPYPGHGTIV